MVSIAEALLLFPTAVAVGHITSALPGLCVARKNHREEAQN
jgi:hypothetical protein